MREELGSHADGAVRAVRASSRSPRRRSARSTSRGCTTARKVAVKVQYPDIEEIVRRDLNTLRRIFRIVELVRPVPGPRRAVPRDPRDRDGGARLPRRGRRTPRGSPRTSRAAPTSRSRASSTSCRPRACSSRTSRPACKITDKAGVKQLGLDRGQLARQVVEIYCQQIFTDGVYHADPHPGNLLVRPRRRRRPADDRVPRLRRGRRDPGERARRASSS